MRHEHLHAVSDFSIHAQNGVVWTMQKENYKKSPKGSEKQHMTVAEAGRRGGRRTAETHGHEFYESIGHKGGQKVKELIEAGKKAKRKSSDN